MDLMISKYCKGGTELDIELIGINTPPHIMFSTTTFIIQY